MKKLKQLIKKLRIIDYFIILVLIALGIFGFIRLFRKSTYIDIVVKTYKPDWFIEQLRPGMEEKNILGETMGKIESVKTFPDKNKYYYERYRQSHIKLKLKVIYSPGENSYVYKGKKITVGSYLDFYINNFFIDGKILNINDDSKNKKRVYKIKSKGRIFDINPAFPYTEGVSNYIADSIQKGMIMKDSLGNPAVKIEEKNIEEAKTITFDNNGQIQIQKNPLRKDIYLDLTIWAEKINNYYYLFGDETFPIIIGSEIPFNYNQIWTYITVTEIINVEVL